MSNSLKVLWLVLLLTALLISTALVYVRLTELSTQSAPGWIETRIARMFQQVAVPAGIREQQNPVPISKAVIAEGLSHFADHCAICHGNDGAGDTNYGQRLFPRSPDLRLPETQNRTDGELFHTIEHGIRFTGMPGFGDGTEEGVHASWHLVHFIRHLRDLTEDELVSMEELNPRPPAEVRQEIEEERFLLGLDDSTFESNIEHDHGAKK